ncbi:hypothetical protein KFU94_23305 [Chloroflexi bacterium TSY]|nr:hypothetical protein [Chloroflexi bacterium TSY]
MAVPILVLTGWWFIRNWRLYGDLLGWSAYVEVFRVNLRSSLLTGNDIRHFFSTQFNSFWGRFGWMNIWSPSWFYMWIRLLMTMALVGLFVFVVRCWRKLSSFQQLATGTLLLMSFTYESYMLWAITKFNDSWYQGRYIFPIIAPLMLLMSIGPSYSTIPEPKWRAWLLPHQTDYQFGDSFLLRGYELETGGLQLVLNLYWQAKGEPDFNYSAFVHLLDENDNILIQDDHAPGESVGYPPKVWQNEDIVVGRYTLESPANLPINRYRLRVGLYNWETGQRLKVYSDDEYVGEYVILSE